MVFIDRNVSEKRAGGMERVSVSMLHITIYEHMWQRKGCILRDHGSCDPVSALYSRTIKKVAASTPYMEKKNGSYENHNQYRHEYAENLKTCALYGRKN